MKQKMSNIKRPSRAAGFVNSGKGNAWRANRVCLAIVLLALHQITTYFCVMQKRYNFGSVVSIPLFFSEKWGAEIRTTAKLCPVRLNAMDTASTGSPKI